MGREQELQILYLMFWDKNDLSVEDLEIKIDLVELACVDRLETETLWFKKTPNSFQMNGFAWSDWLVVLLSELTALNVITSCDLSSTIL